MEHQKRVAEPINDKKNKKSKFAALCLPTITWSCKDPKGRLCDCEGSELSGWTCPICKTSMCKECWSEAAYDGALPGGFSLAMGACKACVAVVTNCKKSLPFDTVVQEFETSDEEREDIEECRAVNAFSHRYRLIHGSAWVTKMVADGFDAAQKYAECGALEDEEDSESSQSVCEDK